MGVIFRPLWTGSNKRWRQMAWIGPDSNLKPESRKTLSTIDKRSIISRQGTRCNFCNEKINTEPYVCGDFDHIIPLNLGGKNMPCNIQLLCVSCHRQKTALENKGTIKVIDISTTKNDVFIVHNERPKNIRPFDAKTPIEITDEDDNDAYIILYTENRRNSIIIDENKIENIFDRFKYTG